MSALLPEAIQVLLVDDHPLVIEGIVSLLRNVPHIHIVATASGGEDALAQLQVHPELQVAIVDLNMPGMTGVELIRHMHQLYPRVRTMALSVYYDYSSVTDVLEAGGSGYLLKNTSKQELIEAVGQVHAGRTFFSPEVGAVLLQNIPRAASPAPVEGREDKPVELTAREMEVLQLIAHEYPNSLIAEKLFISERTVESHRKNILTKTNSKSVVGLIQYALRHKLIQ